MDDLKGCAVFLLILCGLSLAVACVYFFIRPDLIPNFSHDATPIPTKATSAFKAFRLDRYNLTLTTPSDWTSEQFSDAIDRQTKQKCSTYVLTDANGNVRVKIVPSCGYGEWLPSTCPLGTQSIQKLSNTKSIVRYYDGNINSYVYTMAGETQTRTSMGTTPETYCTNPPVVLAKNIKLNIEVILWLDGDKVQPSLQIVDQIVSSIR